MEKVERDEKITRKIHEMNIRVRRKDARYMVREESKKENLRTKTRRRAIRYEEELEKKGDSRWARKC